MMMFQSVHDVMVIKLFSVAGAVGGIFSLALQSLSPAGISILTTAISVLGSIVVAFGVLWISERHKERVRKAEALSNAHHTDGVVVIEREKLLDERVDTIFTELKEFYSLRDRESQSSINLLKEFVAQRDILITQQRELITQQAGTIQSLMK